MDFASWWWTLLLSFCLPLMLMAVASPTLLAILLLVTWRRQTTALTSRLLDHQGELERLLAAKDAITYRELADATQRESRDTAYEGSTRYHNPEEARIERERLAQQAEMESQERARELAAEQEELDALNAFPGPNS